MVTDIAIAGGSVAGSSLAILLGRAGFTVQLIERDCFPREKPCGEGIMPAGVAALERLGLLDEVGGTPFRGVRYHCGGLVAEGRFPIVSGLPRFGIGQRRRRLDRVLFDAAAATRGVVAESGVAVLSPLLENGRVTGVATSRGDRRARFVVAADGLDSPLRSRLGLDGRPNRHARVGIRAHYRVGGGVRPGEWVEVYIGRGYELYATPLPDGELLVAGLAERRAIVRGVHQSFRQWIAEQPALGARLGGAERLDGYAGRAVLVQAARSGFAPGIVLLGDAAGSVDPITGGGITQALLSAEVLARSMPEILCEVHGALDGFDRRRRALLRDYVLLTRSLTTIARHPRLVGATLRLMKTAPSLFSHLLGVSAGMCPLLPYIATLGRRTARTVAGEGSGGR